MIVENPNRTEQLIRELTAVWETSVKATHKFLNEEDIAALYPFVETGVRSIEHLIVVYEDQRPAGFLGIAEGKVEMLFLKPEYIGKGIGKRLISKAVHDYKGSYVDVNEQNPHAVEFYKHCGFEVIDRTEFDEQGNPFPILKMRLKETFLLLSRENL